MNAQTMAPAAAGWLRATTHGRILHRFNRALNLINQQGDFLSLVTAEAGPAPFAVVLAPTPRPLDLSTLVPETAPVTLSPGQLRLGPFYVNLTPAVLWQPRPPWSALRRQSWTDWLEPLAVMLRRYDPGGSLAPLLLAATPPAAPDALANALLSAAGPPAFMLCHALINGAADLESSAAHLAGLGPGLTPAGDDFMLGALLALWSTRPAAQLLPLAERLLATARPRTTGYSAAWLASAAHGEAAQPWHDLFHALLGHDPARVEPAVRRIARTGHSSGADALTGLLMLLRTAVGQSA